MPSTVNKSDVCPTGRADLQHPGVRGLQSRCPGLQVSGRTGSGVRGAAVALSAPRWTPGGSVTGRPGRAQGSTCRRGRWAAWSPAGIGPDGKGMVRRWPWLAGTRSTAAQGRRLAGVPAAAPPWPRRADMGAGARAGVPAGGGEPGTEQVLTGPAGRPGQVAALVPGHGPGPRGGDHAGWSLGEGGPWRSAPEGPLGSVGEQPAAAPRPQRVRSAVR